MADIKSKLTAQNHYLQGVIDNIQMVRRPEFTKEQARDRQINLAARMVQSINAICMQAMEEEIPAPGFIEARDWLVAGLEENGYLQERDLILTTMPDSPLREAKVASIMAAMTNDPEKYIAARAHEAEMQALADQGNGDE